MFISKVICKCGLALTVLVLAFTMTKGQSEERAWVENFEELEIEVWECFDRTEFDSWKIFGERDEGSRPNVLVKLVGALLPSVGRNSGIGTIKMGMVQHVSVFEMEGLTREWRWWGSGSSNYAFVIDPEGNARYYEFKGEGSATPTSLLGCELQDLTASEERTEKMSVIRLTTDSEERHNDLRD